MDQTKDQPGLLVRTPDDTLFFVPLADLTTRYRLPDDQQRGSPEGDGVIDALGRSPMTYGIKNAILSDRIVVVDVAAGSPTGGKQRFAAGILETVEAAAPTGGKQRFASGLLEAVEAAAPSGGKQRFAAGPGEG